LPGSCPISARCSRSSARAQEAPGISVSLCFNQCCGLVFLPMPEIWFRWFVLARRARRRPVSLVVRRGLAPNQLFFWHHRSVKPSLCSQSLRLVFCLNFVSAAGVFVVAVLRSGSFSASAFFTGQVYPPLVETKSTHDPMRKSIVLLAACSKAQVFLFFLGSSG
jgi:hypothetical protein